MKAQNEAHAEKTRMICILWQQCSYMEAASIGYLAQVRGFDRINKWSTINPQVGLYDQRTWSTWSTEHLYTRIRLHISIERPNEIEQRHAVQQSRGIYLDTVQGHWCPSVCQQSLTFLYKY